MDAEAIAEAVERKNMRFVPIKTDDQLDLQAIHRVRDRLICRRTAVINQLRAFLLERGMTFAKTPAELRSAMPDILENAEADLTPLMRNLIDVLWREWKTVEQQIEELSDELERISAADAGCTRIRQIPGIGPIVATAIVAATATALPFARAETSLPGSALCRGSTRLEARRSCSASASAATSIYARFLSTVRERLCCASSGIVHRLEPGWTDWMPELLKTSSWSPWPTSLRGLPGRCCRAGKTTGHLSTRLQHRAARKRRLRLGSAHALPL